ncbi:hypothetical protein KY360_06950 [Candidatus Woesearchaeota archaeon]|nr:hypothetical protein [Candidatus Woesearchaeota archaeon]
MKKALIAVLILSLFLIGCAPKEEAEAGEQKTGVSDVDDVSSGISDVDTIDDDLGGEELDDLEKDLAEIDW